MHGSAWQCNVQSFLANLHDYEMLPLAKFQLLLFLLKMSDCAVFHWLGLWLCKLQMFGCAVCSFYSTEPSEDWLHEPQCKITASIYKSLLPQ